MKYIMCVDGGGTALKYNVMSTEGKLIMASSALPTPRTKEEFVEVVTGFVQNAEQKISGLAFSMPGYINSQTGYHVGGGALAFMAGNYYTDLFKHLDIPVSLENDGRAFAVAEHEVGAAQGMDDFVVLTIGTGIGAGIMVNGHLIQGHRYRGGEYGWSLVSTDINNEAVPHHSTCSMTTLIRMYREYEGLDASVKIEGYDIFNEAEKDPGVQKLIDTWYANIAVLVFNAAATFNPEKILLGGGVSARPDLPYKIVETIEKSKLAKPWKEFGTEVATCKFRNDAGFIGAYYHFRKLYPEVE